MVGPMSIRQLKNEGPFFSSAPGTDGVRSTRLRGQGPCAVPEGHRAHQPSPAAKVSFPALVLNQPIQHDAEQTPLASIP